MKISTNKVLKKLEHQQKVNPGHKQDKYNPPPRPRSATFKTGKDKANNRQQTKIDIKKGKYDK